MVSCSKSNWPCSAISAGTSRSESPLTEILRSYDLNLSALSPRVYAVTIMPMHNSAPSVNDDFSSLVIFKFLYELQLRSNRDIKEPLLKSPSRSVTDYSQIYMSVGITISISIVSLACYSSSVIPDLGIDEHPL